MDKQRIKSRLTELRASRDGLAALLDYHHLAGMIHAYEEMEREAEQEEQVPT